ncbi:hypothetical protein PFISCL1PPCAC_13584, partial [Pristionchus fissidentatus]
FILPSLSNSFIFSIIWIILICGVANLLLILCFLAKILSGVNVNVIFWYDPLTTYQFVIIQLFGILVIIYIICAFIASVVACIFRVKRKVSKLVELWLTLFYGLIPYVSHRLETRF